jgi:hypothetical protein
MAFNRLSSFACFMAAERGALMVHMRLGRRILPVMATGVVVAGCLVAASGPAGAHIAAAGTGRPLRVGQIARPPAGAVRLGAVASGQAIHVDVTLKLPHPAALKAFLTAVHDRRSPLFGHFLMRGQFGPRFGPSLATVRAVENVLRAKGLRPGRVASDRIVIPLTASAAAVEHAFWVKLVRYRLPGGRVAYANVTAPRLPASIARYVQGVLGLDNLYQPFSHLVRPKQRHPVSRPTPARAARPAQPAAGPVACAAAATVAHNEGGLTADQLAGYYNMSSMYGLGDFGQGASVALVEFEPNLKSDVTSYQKCYKIPNTVTYIKLDGGAGTGAGVGEAVLDIDNVMGLAPEAGIRVYQEPNNLGDTGTIDIYSAIINGDKDQVVSSSWGFCEPQVDSSTENSEASLFAQANSQGQTVFLAAGDDGSTDCYVDGGPKSPKLEVDDPGAQPYVMSVGGTSVGSNSENVWNDSSIRDGAGGGGISNFWCMPAYQDMKAIPGVINSYSPTTGCGTKVPYSREVPDVSADADPATGYIDFYKGHFEQDGGTSGAAPLWAAVAALIDNSPFCGYYGAGNAGVLPEGLYAAVAAHVSYIYSSPAINVLYDVRNGNNDYSPSGYHGGLYPTTFGYDLASGLGTPLVTGFTPKGKLSMYYPGLAATMCWQYGKKLRSTHVTGVTPRQGPSARSQKITVTGSGFLPIAGADMAEVGSTKVNATCTSTTRCTVTLPKMPPGTVDIRISAEDRPFSPITAADRYRFVAAPTITSLSPNHGPSGGGNTVTINGTNFVGVSSVLFGTTNATNVTVVSATQITVTAPAGSGTVQVTVKAAGGSSASVTADNYQYQ